MAEIITLKGENRIAECQGTGQVLTIDRFILSYDPAIDPAAPIDRNTPLPAADKIVYEDSVTQTGYVNPNQVVYSLFMDSTVGPFEFNRMDLVESATDTNVAITTLPTQNKIADDPGAGIRGQSMTRNFMTIYDGAATITNITMEAATWQIDFMARLHASDELERLSSRDTWGRSCFWRDGFLVQKVDNGFQLVAGLGYVEGIRIQASVNQTISPDMLPTDVWLDVCRRGNLNGVKPEFTAVFYISDQHNYTDKHQVDHYLERIASINSAGTVTDRRTVHPIDDALLNYLVPEAPEDGKQYVRMDGQWVEVLTDNEWRPGDIKMFAGSESQIQVGWQLCNGVGQTSNGINIPDLRSRFIIGSGGSYSTSSIGGSTSSTTSTSGSHSHTVSIDGHTLSESHSCYAPANR
ncbi:phage tail protein [Endozoicomonas sp. SCSIO W0465]|uniref:phage tail-collar fiber domain-containing protein n=1 Tax=Endozoicomonas sp. SCSIO W0465 TaxID=2918516 RepID=UPI002076244F|nr:phage tail protein [Endozoicomonas sp. SCSIO W0465]USE39122.1 phage tail protein [Endozoicomonas sp. SCSIO W0465]